MISKLSLTKILGYSSALQCKNVQSSTEIFYWSKRLQIIQNLSFNPLEHDGPQMSHLFRFRRNAFFIITYASNFYEGVIRHSESESDVKISKFKTASCILRLKLRPFFDDHNTLKRTFFLRFNAPEIWYLWVFGVADYEPGQLTIIEACEYVLTPVFAILDAAAGTLSKKSFYNIKLFWSLYFLK